MNQSLLFDFQLLEVDNDAGRRVFDAGDVERHQRPRSQRNRQQWKSRNLSGPQRTLRPAAGRQQGQQGAESRAPGPEAKRAAAEAALVLQGGAVLLPNARQHRHPEVGRRRRDDLVGRVPANVEARQVRRSPERVLPRLHRDVQEDSRASLARGRGYGNSHINRITFTTGQTLLSPIPVSI